MQEIERSALLPYPTDFVFQLVNDVARYPEFLPWCESADVLQAAPGEMVARLGIRVKGVRETFTTRNRLIPHRSIELDLVEGPFQEFTGRWRFDPIGQNAGCRVSIRLQFTLKRGWGLVGRTLSVTLGRAADRALDAFADRARVLSGQ